MKISFEVSDEIVALIKVLDGIVCYRDDFRFDPADIELRFDSYLLDGVIIDIGPDGYHILCHEKPEYSGLAFIQKIYKRLKKYIDHVVTEEELKKFLEIMIKEEEKNDTTC